MSEHAPQQLPSELSIADVLVWHQRFLQCNAQRESIELDGSLVQRIDTAGLQLLAVLSESRQAAGDTPLQWCAVSQPLARAAATLGMSALLNLPDCSY